MREYNYRSDFSFYLTPATLLGDIPVDLSNDFDGEVTSGHHARRYFFSRREGVLSNCRVEGDKILVICDDHGLQSGRLSLQLTYHNPNEVYPDGVEDIVGRAPLDIMLTRGEASDTTPAEVGIVLPLVSASIYDIAVSKGYTGTQEDYYEALAAVALKADMSDLEELARALADALALKADASVVSALADLVDSQQETIVDLQAQLDTLTSNTVDMEVTYTDDTTETIRLVRVPIPASEEESGTEGEEGGAS